jgi:hypothetical protein
MQRLQDKRLDNATPLGEETDRAAAKTARAAQVRQYANLLQHRLKESARRPHPLFKKHTQEA